MSYVIISLVQGKVVKNNIADREFAEFFYKTLEEAPKNKVKSGLIALYSVTNGTYTRIKYFFK